MATYYSHKENEPGGVDGAILDYARQKIHDIEKALKALDEEKRVWEHLAALKGFVCQICAGEGVIGWLPPGAFRGQGLYRHVPCSGCRLDEYIKATK